MFLLLIFINLVFAYFFYKIDFFYGNYFVWAIFVIMIIISLFSDFWQKSIKILVKKIILDYLMYINFLIINFWLFFIINYFLEVYFWDSVLTSLKSLSIISVFIFIVYFYWVILNKQNALKISYFWFFIVWIYMFFLLDKNFHVFEFFLPLIWSISVLWHLVYFIRYNKYNKFILYIIFLSFVVNLFLLIKNILNITPNALSLIIQITVLIILFYSLYIEKIYNSKMEIRERIKQKKYEINVFWYSDINVSSVQEEDLKKFYKRKKYYEIVLDFFVGSPKIVKIIFALTNSVPVIFASWYFFKNLQSWNGLYNEVIYWSWWLIFFINFILFKKLNWFVSIQRIFAFFVINFVTYFTIIDFMWHDYLYISIWGIVWNLLITVIMIWLWKNNKFLSDFDYIVWSVINFLCVIINIYFLFKIWLNLYLSLWIVLLYLWLYLFLYRIIYKKFFMNN